MPGSSSLGEFEQLVLLAVLRLQRDAYGIEIRRVLQEEAARKVSRGALYNTLERLGDKGLLTWELSESTPERGGVPRRRFVVTPDGVAVLKRCREVLLHLWSAVEEALD